MNWCVTGRKAATPCRLPRLFSRAVMCKANVNMTATLEEIALFPLPELLLHRAAEALILHLKQPDPHHPGITPAELDG